MKTKQKQYNDVNMVVKNAKGALTSILLSIIPSKSIHPYLCILWVSFYGIKTMIFKVKVNPNAKKAHRN